MNVSKQQLQDAADKGIITSEQAGALYDFLNAQSQPTAKFTFTNVLYYIGGLIAIGAMTLFMNLGWEAFGGLGIVLLSVVYALVGLKITHSFSVKGLVVPAGLSATFVVCLTPLAVYGLQQELGIWPDDSVYREYHRYIKWHWLYMEMATLAVGVAMAWKYKYPFLVMPIAVTLWYMTMDLTAMLNGGDYSWELRKLVSLYAGLLMVALAFWVDIRSRHTADYAFWLYLFGVTAFWFGLTLQHSASELAKFGYFCINLVLIAVGVLLVRRIFVVFGALGCCGYVGYLAADVFSDSWLFPITLTLIGFGVVYLGICWQKHEHRITTKARSYLPQALRELLETRAH